LDISDLVGWYVYWGFSDAPRTRLYSLMNNGDCIFDVGANLGEVSANAAKLVGPHGRVIAFEPYPANFDLLAKNVELNGFENLMIVNKGVGSENGKLKMVVADESNAGMNRISDNPVSDEGNTTEVEVVRLDDFVDQIGLEDIDLIKIDVEGFEMNVLRGAETVLSTLRPKLFLEVIDNYLRLQGSSANEVLQFLESLHYELTYAASGNPVDSRDNFSDTQFDVVALPKKVRETP
jgi:FkbM family methyltransferase